MTPTFPAWADVTDRTGPALLARAVRRRGDRTALLAASQGRDGELVAVGWAELAERSSRLATGLRELGVTPGDRVGLLMDNRWAAEAFTVYHANHALGAINVTLNGRWVAHELARGLDLAAPSVVVCGQPWVPLLREALRSVRAGVAPRLVVIGDDSYHRLATRPELADPHPVTEHDEADWVFTSGTTGDPKAVTFTHGATAATGMQVALAWGLREDDVYQSPSPLFTSTGCRTNLLSTLATGCTYLPEPVPDLDRMLDLVRTREPTVYFGVSSMFRLLLDRHRDRLGVLGALRRLNYGGMIMPRSFHEEVSDVFDGGFGLEVMHLAGLTEGGPTGVYARPDDTARKPGSVGDRGFSPWTEVSVRDVGDDGRGELYLRSPSTTRTFVTGHGERSPALVDGWLATGDVVSSDADGFLYFEDRKRDLIRRGGLNIASGEVESAFKRHPAVLEVAVVAKPHRVLGEDLCAFVVLDAGRGDVAEVRAFCAEQVADYKVPRDIRVLDELPLNSMGRVRKGQLRQLLRDE